MFCVISWNNMVEVDQHNSVRIFALRSVRCVRLCFRKSSLIQLKSVVETLFYPNQNSSFQVFKKEDS